MVLHISYVQQLSWFCFSLFKSDNKHFRVIWFNTYKISLLVSSFKTLFQNYGQGHTVFKTWGMGMGITKIYTSSTEPKKVTNVMDIYIFSHLHVFFSSWCSSTNHLDHFFFIHVITSYAHCFCPLCRRQLPFCVIQ